MSAPAASPPLLLACWPLQRQQRQERERERKSYYRPLRELNSLYLHLGAAAALSTLQPRFRLAPLILLEAKVALKVQLFCCRRRCCCCCRCSVAAASSDRRLRERTRAPHHRHHHHHHRLQRLQWPLLIKRRPPLVRSLSSKISTFLAAPASEAANLAKLIICMAPLRAQTSL